MESHLIYSVYDPALTKFFFPFFRVHALLFSVYEGLGVYSVYKLSEKVKHNQPLHKLLDNGYRFVLVSKSGLHLKYAMYEYQLTIVKKCNRGSKVREIKEFLL